MQVDWNECVGFIGGMLFVVQYIPQIVKIRRFKHSDDISSAYLAISCIASATTLVYGTLINSLSLIVTVSLSIGCKMVIFGLKRKYDTKTVDTRRQSRDVADERTSDSSDAHDLCTPTPSENTP